MTQRGTFGVMAAQLTLAELQDIRDDCLADDIDIDYDLMKSWDRARAARFFENGGEDLPPSPPPTPPKPSPPEGKDHYSTLGVTRDCSDAEIKKAYHKLAIRCEYFGR